VTTLCPGAAERLTDLVGAGSADCREGQSADDNAPWPGLIHRAILRACEGGIDTQINAADWFDGVPQPRNVSTPAASGVTITSAQAVGPSPVIPGQTLVISASVADCTGAGFAQVVVRVDGRALDAPADILARDDGVFPDTIAGDGTFAASLFVGPAALPGEARVGVVASTPGPRFALGHVNVLVAAPPLGACCLGSGCETIGLAACTAAGGRWLGAGVSCVPLSPFATPRPYAGIPIFDFANDRFDFTITGTGLVVGPAGIRLALNLQHSWVGDLVIEISNINSSETIIARVGQSGGVGPGSPANLNGWYTFHELARASIWSAAAAAGEGPAATIPPGISDRPPARWRATFPGPESVCRSAARRPLVPPHPRPGHR
jgi:hypothetical protein